MVYTTYLWWLGGWFVIVLTTLYCRVFCDAMGTRGMRWIITKKLPDLDHRVWTPTEHMTESRTCCETQWLALFLGSVLQCNGWAIILGTPFWFPHAMFWVIIVVCLQCFIVKSHLMLKAPFFSWLHHQQFRKNEWILVDSSPQTWWNHVKS